jgi:N-acetylmuramoyl-L-alanine amidase
MCGAHCKGHNANSIGIAYVGGLDACGKPADTRTPAQRDALKVAVRVLRDVFGDVPVHGHNEYANKGCPCFDVAAEFGNKLKRQNND